MRATNSSPVEYNSFIASSSNSSTQSPNIPNIAGAWQISTSSNTNNLYFGYCNKKNKGTNWIALIPFDTKVHIYYIQYKISTKLLTISVDGLTKVVHTVANGRIGPSIDELRLFRNRNLDTYIAAEFNELFLSKNIFSFTEKLKATNYLIYKWGVNI